MCGEHCRTAVSDHRNRGSSPHVRGAPYRQAVFRHRAGIIPACAGSTRFQRTYHRYAMDHPRMCGEHALPLTRVNITPGSSPHVRGARWHRLGVLELAGIIPACAGSTWDTTLTLWHRRDHPRMCGEHRLHSANRNLPQGSSPHVRGARHYQRQQG